MNEPAGTLSRVEGAMRGIAAAAVAALALPAAAHASGTSLARLQLSPQGGAVAQRFDLVGLHWQGRGTILFRTRGLDGRWSHWQPAESEPDDVPDANTPEGRRSRGWRLGNPYWAGPSDGLQYRVRGPVRRIRAFFIGGGRSARPAFTLTSANAPPIIPRAAWGAIESIRRGKPRYADALKLAIIHHTAGTNAYSRSQSAAIVRSIELYHVRGNGWDDIGYNFLVDRYGQVFEGRYGGIDRPVIGAHALGFNNGSVGVAYIGNGISPITAAARSALVKLLAWRLDVAHVDPLSKVTFVSSGNYKFRAGTPVTLRAISGHRDTGPTECPGNSLYGQIPAITRAVAATGLPKIYSPVVRGGLGGKVRFTARLSSSVQWTVSVTDAFGKVVASGTGLGTNVDWTWDASAVTSGRYAWSISAPNARSATGSIGGPVARLTLTDLFVDPPIVSPNGDGYDDVLHGGYTLGTAANVTTTLLDSGGNPVGSVFTGSRSAGRHAFVLRDISLPDGRYTLLLNAMNAAGTVVSGSVSFVVDRTLAFVSSTSLFMSPNGDGRLDSVVLRYRLLAPADVAVRVLRNGRVVRTLFGGHVAPGSYSIPWDGSGLRDGSYVVRVQSVDQVATVTEDVPITVDTRPPLLRLVSLRPLVLQVNEPATVTATIGRRRIAKTVVAGKFRLPYASHFSIVAVDRAGNRTRFTR